MNKLFLPALICLLFVASPPLISQKAGDLRPGIIHERIPCGQDPGETYAIYLPDAYTREKTWPLLLCFDPGGIASKPMNIFKAAANEMGYILACPDRVKNGPVAPSYKALKTVWLELSREFPLDKQRIYAGGFSGGAHMASLFTRLTGQTLQGILSCGAVLSPDIGPEEINGTLFFGLIGLQDFNYREMVHLQQQLASRSRPSRFLYIHLTHSWPPEAQCRRALEWFELMAMKEGQIPRDPERIETLFKREFMNVSDREKAGEIFYAADEFADMYRTFSGLLEQNRVQPLDEKHQQLKASRAYIQFARENHARILREEAIHGKAAMAFATFRRGIPPGTSATQIITGLGLKSLTREASRTKNPDDADMIKRVLSSIAGEATRQMMIFIENNRLSPADSFAEIAARASEGTRAYPVALYNQAVILARQKKNKQAMKMLKEAVDSGFSYISPLREDHDLDSLRELPEFKALLQKVQERTTEKTDAL